MGTTLKEEYLRSVELGQVNDSLAELLDDVDKLNTVHLEDSGIEYCKADVEQVQKYYRDNCLQKIELVRELGEKIGYGAMMSFASALWRYSLVHEHKLVDGLGAFVPRITTELSDEEIMFDQWVNVYYKQKDKSKEVIAEAVTRKLIAIHVHHSNDLTRLHYSLLKLGYTWQGVSCIQGCHMIRESTKRVYLTIDKELKLVTCTSGRPRLDPYIYEMHELYDIDESLDSVLAFH